MEREERVGRKRRERECRREKQGRFIDEDASNRMSASLQLVALDFTDTHSLFRSFTVLASPVNDRGARVCSSLSNWYIVFYIHSRLSA